MYGKGLAFNLHAKKIVEEFCLMQGGSLGRTGGFDLELAFCSLLFRSARLKSRTLFGRGIKPQIWVTPILESVRRQPQEPSA